MARRPRRFGEEGMIEDLSLYLFFYGFGLASGVFVSWLESYSASRSYRHQQQLKRSQSGAAQTDLSQPN
jgi:hypothetical protein